MLWLLTWMIYGLIVGSLAKFFHTGPDPLGFFPTIGIGIAGSYIGGMINWLLGWGESMFEPSGILMGVVGGVVFCWIYKKYNLSQYVEMQKLKDE